MKKYLEIMQDIIENGEEHVARTKENRISIFGVMAKFKMADGFPLVTTRSVPYKSMIKETLWFLTGSNNITSLQEQGVHIWDSWALNKDNLMDAYINMNKKVGLLPNEDDPAFLAHLEASKEIMQNDIGNIGYMYGNLWRNHPNPKYLNSKIHPGNLEDKSMYVASDKMAIFIAEYAAMPEDVKVNHCLTLEKHIRYRSVDTIDQIQELIVNLRERPFSSRHVVSAWSVGLVASEKFTPQENVYLGNGSLAACHAMFQCMVKEGKDGGKKRLSLMMYQRSADFPVGSVFNIAQYALLLHLFAHVTDMEADELIYTIGDCHIYDNQLELAKEQLTRAPRELPTIRILTDEKDIFKIRAEDIEIIGYVPDKAIAYPIAI